MNISQAQQAYFEEVWCFVRQIPSGKVVTYGQIAKALPEPQDIDFKEQATSPARLVGSAMSASPADVPWHRVINAQGGVSSRSDAKKQVHLLEAEGLQFIGGRIDLNKHQWLGADQADRPEQHELF